ncbi:MAG TPA: adenylate/guanylate cyclase domain-containing protein [Burkholderiales bacterium]|nr:adenylate/guanylate cyclase domain-containing protein [Burkholderiales bacterium]
MRESHIRDALRRIQDIVFDATGSALPAEHEKRLTHVLASLAGDRTRARTVENFSDRDVTILLADLRGFTSLSASHPAGVVLEVLNQCFVTTSEAIVRHQGTIDKFAGDSIMAIFTASDGSRAEPVHRALACAVEMQIEMQKLNEVHRQRNLPELYMGIGVNTGRVMAGLVGSELYSAYALIGEEVSLTSRIEAFSLRGQVLISESTYALCREYAATGDAMEVYVKGKVGRMQLREVVGIPSLELSVPRQEVRRSPRIAVKLPFSFQRVEKKIVVPQRMPGTILDVGYHGVLADMRRELPLHSEIKLGFELPLVSHTADDIYARVVKRSEGNVAGLEFTSLSIESTSKLQLFVQMLLQGHEVN